MEIWSDADECKYMHVQIKRETVLCVFERKLKTRMDGWSVKTMIVSAQQVLLTASPVLQISPLQ